MRLGMNTVLFGGSDLRTALQHVAWAGYRHVELAAIAGMCEHVKLGRRYRPGEGAARGVRAAADGDGGGDQ